MSKITKKELKSQLDGVQNRFASLVRDLKASGYICESVYAPFAHDYQKEQSDYGALMTILDSKEPQLKQLDQSIFDGLDEKWRFAAVDKCGEAYVYEHKPHLYYDRDYWFVREGNYKDLTHSTGYNTSNWQNSLIERDIDKELLEVDLSSELTGSDYYYSKSVTERLENGQELVMCFVSNVSESDAMQERHIEVITSVDTELNDTDGYGWQYAVPINNQGEPLTAAEAGL